MISKVEFQAVINKYYLNGLIEGVKWDVKDNNLNIKFTAPTREMIGEINYSNFNLVDSSVGISNTTQLLKLIGISSGEIMLDYIKNGKTFTKLIIADNQFTVNYALADILTIPKTGAFNGSNIFNLETNLDTEIITALIKANNVLSKTIIDKFILQEYIDTIQSSKDIKTDEEIHQESFLNFVSESRDWAFEYIENVQAALNKFVAETDPSIEYFEKYGDVVAGPNNEILKKISVSYKELKNILPKDQDV